MSINNQYTKDDTGVVHNNNIDEFQRYKLEREKLLLQRTLEERVTKLEHELNELRKKLS